MLKPAKDYNLPTENRKMLKYCDDVRSCSIELLPKQIKAGGPVTKNTYDDYANLTDEEIAKVPVLDYKVWQRQEIFELLNDCNEAMTQPGTEKDKANRQGLHADISRELDSLNNENDEICNAEETDPLEV